MNIGVPKEIKNNENRVGLTPGGVSVLVRHGHQVSVETMAGIGSSFTAPNRPLTEALLCNKVTGIAYETVE